MNRGKNLLWLMCVLGAAACLFSAGVTAQEADMTFGVDETEQPAEEPVESEQVFADEEMGATDEDVLSSLGIEEEGGEAPEEGEAAPKKEPGVEKGEHPIWAVQQIYAVKGGRFELMPFYGISMNDPYIVHSCFGVGLNYYITEVLALGVNFLWFQGFNADTDTMFHVGRSYRLAVPVNEYQLNANLNFSYVPLYGKFALFNEWIVHWDAWIIGGVGLMRTKPVPMIDPDIRSFDWNNLLSFNVGIGGRIFLSRFLAVFLEIRDYMFMEKVENQAVQNEDNPNDENWPNDSANWYGPDVFTSNVMVHAGVSIFIPFTFDYELTK